MNGVCKCALSSIIPVCQSKLSFWSKNRPFSSFTGSVRQASPRLNGPMPTAMKSYVWSFEWIFMVRLLLPVFRGAQRAGSQFFAVMRDQAEHIGNVFPGGGGVQ